MRPASSNLEQIANALIDIWSAKVGIDGMFFKFKDDINCLCFPNLRGHFYQDGSYYAHNRNSILNLVASLNMPWYPEKSDTKFLFKFSFISFTWDIILKQVLLPDIKQCKYLDRVIFIKNNYKTLYKAFHLRDIQFLHGALIYMCFVFLDGSSWLSVFSNFMSSSGRNNFVKCHLSNSFIHTLKWWKARLKDIAAYHQLFLLLPLENLSIFVDVSTSWDIDIGWESQHT